ncbi:MAG: hypothetical protein KDA52_12270 [Planctomycetaceae bacterium]|nr:hypothetical protein [Planctomycetaceae bacterium]
MIRKRTFSLAAAWLLLTLLTVPQTASARDLNDAIDGIVDRVQKYLSDHGDSSVTVGNFAGPPSSSAGIRIKAALTERLTEADIKVSKLARLEIRGTFASETEPNPIVLIQAEMIDQTGATLGDFRERISVESVEDVVNLLGATTDLATTTAESTAVDATQRETLEQRDDQLAEDITTPSFALTGTAAVSATASSPFRIEIFLRDAGSLTPVPVQDFSGFALVNLNKGQEYVVKLHNASKIDVGVKLTIDGVNTFEFSENAGFRDLGMWMVPAGQVGTVDGWHINNNESLSFLVTDVPDSATAKLQRETTAIGTITASFFPAWTGDDIPEEEIIGKARGDIGTGLGTKIGSAYETVQRHFGATLLAAVSVRYEKPDPPVDLPTETTPSE